VVFENGGHQYGHGRRKKKKLTHHPKKEEKNKRPGAWFAQKKAIEYNSDRRRVRPTPRRQSTPTKHGPNPKNESLMLLVHTRGKKVEITPTGRKIKKTWDSGDGGGLWTLKSIAGPRRDKAAIQTRGPREDVNSIKTYDRGTTRE